MEKIAVIIRLTLNDDSEGSITKQAKVCESFDLAKADVISEVCKGFDMECSSFEEMAEVLNESGIDSGVNGDNVFYWGDNGKGEEYTILEVGSEYDDVNII